MFSNDLLQRCVGANTQNNNESYNAYIWQIAPKHILSGRKIVEISTYCAACSFNEGFQPILKISVSIGVKAKNLVQAYDEAHILKADKMSNEASKEQRMAGINARLEENEDYEKTEEIIYGSGIAD